MNKMNKMNKMNYTQEEEDDFAVGYIRFRSHTNSFLSLNKRFYRRLNHQLNKLTNRFYASHPKVRSKQFLLTQSCFMKEMNENKDRKQTKKPQTHPQPFDIQCEHIAIPDPINEKQKEEKEKDPTPPQSINPLSQDIQEEDEHKTEENTKQNIPEIVQHIIKNKIFDDVFDFSHPFLDDVNDFSHPLLLKNYISHPFLIRLFPILKPLPKKLHHGYRELIKTLHHTTDKNVLILRDPHLIEYTEELLFDWVLHRKLYITTIKVKEKDTEKFFEKYQNIIIVPKHLDYSDDELNNYKQDKECSYGLTTPKYE